MMLRWLQREWRVRAAIAVAVLYALCVLAPGVAVAFNGPAAVHCLTTSHGIASAHEFGEKPHVHADGTVHHHAAQKDAAVPPHGDGDEHPGKCCGLFCMSALALQAEPTIATEQPLSLDFPALEAKLTGRGASRIDRPPNV